MESKIKNKTEISVEEYLEISVKRLNKPGRRGTKVTSWIFNSIYGSYSFNSNKRIISEEVMTKEEVAEYHAERQCIKNMPKKFKTEGTNTMYVSLIPCDLCIEYLIDLKFDVNVIFFADKYNKFKTKKYQNYLKEINMIKYKNNGSSKTSIKINGLIKEIETYTN